MQELKNADKKGISTKRKIGKTTYEVVVHFNENATETMQDKLTRIMLRELQRKTDEKKMILIKKSLTSSNSVADLPLRVMLPFPVIYPKYFYVPEKFCILTIASRL